LSLWKSSRRRYYPAARAIRAFAARDGTDLDWAGALLVTEAMDDLRFVRSFLEAYAKANKRRRPR